MESTQIQPKIRKTKGNEICADCSNRAPTFVSFLIDHCQKSQVSVEGVLAVLICDACAELHKVHLKTKPKRLEQCTKDEFKVVQTSGNAFVNGFYEVVHFDYEKKPISTKQEKKRQAAFIQSKYKDCKYRNDVSLYMTLSRLWPDRDNSACRSNTQNDNGGIESIFSNQYSHLSSLVKTSKAATPRIENERLPQSPVNKDKLRKLKAGMAKAAEGLQSMDYNEQQIHSAKGEGIIHQATEILGRMEKTTPTNSPFEGLAGKVESMALKERPIDPSKLEKLSKGMHVVNGKLGGQSSHDMFSWEELEAAQEMGANMAKAYDDDAAHVQQIAKNVMGNNK